MRPRDTEKPTTLDFSAFEQIRIGDLFDCDASLELTSHGRSSTVQDFRHELLNDSTCNYDLPNPKEVWNLDTLKTKRDSGDLKHKAAGAEPGQLSHANVNSALGITKSGISGVLEARLKQIRTA